MDMTKVVLRVWVVILIIMGGNSMLSAAFVSLTNPSITPAPLDAVESNGTGIITFGMVETSNATAPVQDALGDENILISVELNKLKLDNDDVSVLRGTLMDYFSASYNVATNIIILIQTAPFPGFGEANLSIPVVVTANSLSSDHSLNGFNANISANDAGTTAEGNAASFTYTSLPIVATNDTKTSFDGQAGGIVITNIVSNDNLDANTPSLGTDVNITAVTNDTLLVVNVLTGSVSVPANTADGTYTETYTLCENLNPNNCDTATISVLVETSIPDYIPTLYAQGTIINGSTGILSVVIRIGEFNDGINSAGDVLFTVAKNASLVLSFDPTETTRQGRALENSLWELRETSGLYIFTYTGNGRMFPPLSASRVGLSGVFTSPSSSKGAFPLDVTVASGSGEIKTINNKDTDILEYNNLGN